MLFDWNDRKAGGNAKKHGVTFDEAMTSFFDEAALDLASRTIRMAKPATTSSGAPLAAVYSSCPIPTEEVMAKRSGSSQPAKRRRASAAGTTKTRKRVTIDLSDIPEMTDAQLAAAVRKRAERRKSGRPLLGRERRQLIAFRIDVDLLNKLKVDAKRQGIGYQTHIHNILADRVAS